MAQALFKSWFVDFDPVFDNLLASVDFKLENLETSLPDELKQKAQRRLAALNSLENAAEIKTSLIALAHELQALSQTKEAAKSAVQAAETPVKANLNGNPNILAQHANTHAHFPNEFEHNEQLGWIPKGWNASTAEDEFVVKGGSTPSTKNPDFWEGGDIHWTSPKDLSGNTTKIMLDTSRKVTSAGLKKITSGLLPIDTVLMSSRAPVGYLALAKVPVAINQGYIAITDAKALSSEYTIQWLDSVMDEIKGISGGTTFAEISKKTFKSIQLVIPSKKVVEAYTEITKMYYERITACVQEINTLTETRDYLLPKLISGELQIPDVSIDEEVVD
ncbi:restriction endonuclease subunit S [Pseudoalteromonas nigrifaciens]|nr:restriction endonuclease subunit S [Pseudoalteromonas nigrifaciens]